eukprot:2817112-Rhodomonas_salina.2
MTAVASHEELGIVVLASERRLPPVASGWRTHLPLTKANRASWSMGRPSTSSNTLSASLGEAESSASAS